MEASNGPTNTKAPLAAAAPTKIGPMAAVPLAVAQIEAGPTTCVAPIIPAKPAVVPGPVTTVVNRIPNPAAAACAFRIK